MSNKQKLPKRILIMGNADKKFHEKWTPNRDMLNFPHPYRAVLLGPPNVGKSMIVKNILIRAKPSFKEVFVIHCDAEYTKEYENLGDVSMLSTIPPPEYWEGLVKTLVILDDLEYKGMGKEELKALNRLFGYVSTHKNISVILCSQDPFNVPTCVRRCANVWFLWKPKDLNSLNTVASRAGMQAKELKSIFDNLMPDIHDSLCIDSTSKTPYGLRKNAYELIKRK